MNEWCKHGDNVTKMLHGFKYRVSLSIFRLYKRRLNLQRMRSVGVQNLVALCISSSIYNYRQARKMISQTHMH